MCDYAFQQHIGVWFTFSLGYVLSNIYHEDRTIATFLFFQIAVLRCALLVASLVLVVTLAGPQDERRPKISDEALERALNDKRYLQRQLKCALGEASCDPVGRRLKSEWTDAC